MSLTLVAIPIGNPEDLSFRALKCLQQAEVIIGEERKVASALLRSLDIKGKQLELLNEHSTPEDIKELAEFCKSSQVALISDCGTPGFCDPGAHLIKECRKLGIPTDSVPGASSLMHLLSLSSERINEFVFRGFLPAESSARESAWRELKGEGRPIILMDTPYRLKKFLTEIAGHLPQKKVLLGINLTGVDQELIEDRAAELQKRVKATKAPFVALVYASSPARISKKPTSTQAGARPKFKAGKKKTKRYSQAQR